MLGSVGSHAASSQDSKLLRRRSRHRGAVRCTTEGEISRRAARMAAGAADDSERKDLPSRTAERSAAGAADDSECKDLPSRTAERLAAGAADENESKHLPSSRTAERSAAGAADDSKRKDLPSTVRLVQHPYLQ